MYEESLANEIEFHLDSEYFASKCIPGWMVRPRSISWSKGIKKISNEIIYDISYLSGLFTAGGRDFKGTSKETRRKREGDSDPRVSIEILISLQIIAKTVYIRVQFSKYVTIVSNMSNHEELENTPEMIYQHCLWFYAYKMTLLYDFNTWK